MLTELARVLLNAGIGVREFEQAAKIAFVRAASNIALLGNSRVNKSAVAAMTGLTRSEVKRIYELIDDASEVETRGQRALRVLEGWCTDPDFVDARGRPRPLSQRGKHSFAQLVRRYSGDIPPRAILRELIRLDLVNVLDRIVSVRPGAGNKAAVRKVEAVAAALLPTLSRIASQDRASRIVSRVLEVPIFDSKARTLVNRQMDSAIRSFFVNVQSASEGASLPRKPPRKSSARVATISVLVSD